MATADVAIIDGGGANIASLRFALERIGARNKLTTDAREIRSASHVILPGVGAAANAMRTLSRYGLTDVIRELEQPVLGICLGMQLLAAASEEEDTRCLGVFPGTARKLAAAPGLPVPNMGWCRTRLATEHALLRGIDDGSYFYYVHSYALPDTTCALATAEHARPFAAIMSDGNFHATQFHPERSAGAGARLLSNFLELGA